MKKLALAAALIAAPHLVHADTIFGLYAGAGVWNTSAEGEIGRGEEPITADELGMKSSSNNFFYAALEHPIPLVPNIRVAHTGIKLDGQGVVSREFTLGDYTFNANANTVTELDLTHSDFTFYYEFLDNWVTLDLGLTARQLDGYAKADGTVTTEDGTEQRSESVDLSGFVPMVYGRAQFDLPLTGFHAGGAINAIGYDGDNFTDYDVYIGYTLDSIALDVGVDIGYRNMSLNVDDNEDLSADVSVDGVYGALTLHF